MKLHLFPNLFVLFILMFLSACSSMKVDSNSPKLSANLAYSEKTTSRQIISNASISVELEDTTNLSDTIKNIVDLQNGYVLNSTQNEEGSFYASLKVPSKHLSKTLVALSSLGKVKDKTLSIQDVTDRYQDQKAALKNLVALRERLRSLLEKAKDVSEILQVEEQLTRVQTQIDQLEGRLNQLDDQISFSSISFTAEKETVYGPLGYLGVGLWWVLEKLFVITP